VETTWVRIASAVQSWVEDPSETQIALAAGLQTIITQRKQGDFGAFDSDQYVFANDCALEATRTQVARKTLTNTRLANLPGRIR